jgi:hypothetical protein
MPTGTAASDGAASPLLIAKYRRTKAIAMLPSSDWAQLLGQIVGHALFQRIAADQKGHLARLTGVFDLSPTIAPVPTRH